MTPTVRTSNTSPNPFDDWGLKAIYDLSMATQTGLSGMSAYATNFIVPYIISTFYFQKVESKKIFNSMPSDTFSDYMKLLDFNIELVNQSVESALDILASYGQNETEEFLSAVIERINTGNSRYLSEYADHRRKLMDDVVYGYPQAIKSIKSEYGFHFKRDGHELIAETDRFLLYQVAPSEKGIIPHNNAKPILIIPPYVLGANILCFLPKEKRSYVHSFANKGIPTYIRILKAIEDTPALQTMTAEDDALDTRYLCETIFRRHEKKITLNGYCQGGYNALCDLLSGELDELVDAFITCVAPMDGTRSNGLAHFLKKLPRRFNDLAYGTKSLPNGNKVADGQLMGWVYRLKSIASEQPLASFYNDVRLISSSSKEPFKFTKMAAALNHWLIHERNDLPMEITKMSFASYNVPITTDGVLPLRLFNRKLDLNRLTAKKVPWLICYGAHDNLVEPATALAPLDYIQAEVTPFPKGHVAIATSWSTPNSACALDTRFGDGNWRGPVRFHLDLDNSADAVKKPDNPPIQLTQDPHQMAAGAASSSTTSVKPEKAGEPKSLVKKPQKKGKKRAKKSGNKKLATASETSLNPAKQHTQRNATVPTTASPLSPALQKKTNKTKKPTATQKKQPPLKTHKTQPKIEK